MWAPRHRFSHGTPRPDNECEKKTPTPAPPTGIVFAPPKAVLQRHRRALRPSPVADFHDTYLTDMFGFLAFDRRASQRAQNTQEHVLAVFP